MPIPDYQSIMLPLLKYYSDGKEHKNKEAADYISDEFQLSSEEKSEKMQSGQSVMPLRGFVWVTFFDTPFRGPEMIPRIS
jgi:restriction endonuclease Mrr